MRAWLEKRFDLAARGTTVRTELVGGGTTFLTLSYILFVQPAVMSACGIPADTALMATCVGSAFACVAMALLANYPIALAPAMGHNFFFAFTACAPLAAGGLGLTWQQGLAAVVVSGAAFLLLSLVKFRERVLAAVPHSLRHAIAAGIGLLIALLGLEWGGIVKAHPVTLVALGDLGEPAARLALFGLGLTLVLLARGVKAALLIGILATVAGGIACGLIARPERIVSFDLPGRPVALDLDFPGLFRAEHALVALFVLFMLDVFDTVGTLVGVASRAGLMKDGELKDAGKALLADATGIVAGGFLGTSTITSYVESAAGVAAGARTGLANLATAALLLLALPLHPLIAVVGEGVDAGGRTLHPVLAPALVAVGALMARSAAEIRWDDALDALPAFLAMMMIPLAFSITDGVGFGFIAFSAASLAAGKPRRVTLTAHAIAATFLGWYVLRG